MTHAELMEVDRVAAAAEEPWRVSAGSEADKDAVLDALADRVRDGDHAAFDELYFRLVDDLFEYSRGLSHSDSDAEDIVATVFLRAWQYARRYRRGSRSYRGWIFGIARNEVKNLWRSRQRGEQLAEGLRNEQLGSPASPDETVQLDQVIDRALEKLTHEQRDVLALRYFSDMEYPEIARVLGKREGTVRALHFRAIKRLQQAVKHASQ